VKDTYVKNGLRTFLLLLMVVAATGCGSGAKMSGPFVIQFAVYTPLCLEVADASIAQGAVVQTYPCINGQQRQEWLFKPIGNSISYNIVNANSLQCMSVSDSNTSPSTPLVQAPCYSPASPSQVWTFVPAMAPRVGYNFISALSHLCLDVPQGETVGETQMQVFTCTAGDPAQGFVFGTAAPVVIPGT
jgi:hypothetical protein